MIKDLRVSCGGVFVGSFVVVVVGGVAEVLLLFGDWLLSSLKFSSDGL